MSAMRPGAGYSVWFVWQPFPSDLASLRASFLRGPREVTARHERRIDGLREIACRQKEKVRVPFGQGVELYQNSVGRPVNVDRVSLKTHLRPVGREGLDFVEKHDRRTARCRFGDCLREQVRYRALRLSHRRAG